MQGIPGVSQEVLASDLPELLQLLLSRRKGNIRELLCHGKRSIMSFHSLSNEKDVLGQRFWTRYTRSSGFTGYIKDTPLLPTGFCRPVYCQTPAVCRVVETIPVRIITTGRTIAAFENEVAKMPCEAVGNPQPKITWQFPSLRSKQQQNQHRQSDRDSETSSTNQKFVVLDPAASSSTSLVNGATIARQTGLAPPGDLMSVSAAPLAVRNVEIGDAGQYTCTAANAHGSDVVVHTLKVLSAPAVPDFALDAIGYQAVIIRLIEDPFIAVEGKYCVLSAPAVPDFALDAIGYQAVIIRLIEDPFIVVEGKEQASGDAEQTAEAFAEDTEAHLVDLLCGTTYEVKIRARNSHGISRFSVPRTFQTKSEEPPSADPKYLFSWNKTHVAVHLYIWSGGFCVAKRYFVHVRPSLDDDWDAVYDGDTPGESPHAIGPFTSRGPSKLRLSVDWIKAQRERVLLSTRKIRRLSTLAATLAAVDENGGITLEDLEANLTYFVRLQAVGGSLKKFSLTFAGTIADSEVPNIEWVLIEGAPAGGLERPPNWDARSPPFFKDLFVVVPMSVSGCVIVVVIASGCFIAQRRRREALMMMQMRREAPKYSTNYDQGYSHVDFQNPKSSHVYTAHPTSNAVEHPYELAPFAAMTHDLSPCAIGRDFPNGRDFYTSSTPVAVRSHRMTNGGTLTRHKNAAALTATATMTARGHYGVTPSVSDLMAASRDWYPHHHHHHHDHHLDVGNADDVYSTDESFRESHHDVYPSTPPARVQLNYSTRYNDVTGNRVKSRFDRPRSCDQSSF
ncbi:unnamed protein product [Notodromas monacha]|uniref:Uncharacterized protein n=1 Tax=Notodromas monacha TaxID=399045 RepID=A0A7R9GFB8_9CRUS|nr:unnamed protein product [Notodromas monacha]CAG0918981.1 unnamed protein product [Notodromas monacha]